MVLPSTTSRLITITPTSPTLAGRRLLLLVPQENLSLIAPMVWRRTVLSVTKNVRLASLALVQSAGKTAQRRAASVTTEHTVTSLMPMVEVLVKFTTAERTANSGVTSSILSATTTSTTSVAVSALPTAHLVWLISESLAPSPLTAVSQASPLSAIKTKFRAVLSATPNVITVPKVSVQFAGASALQAPESADLSASVRTISAVSTLPMKSKLPISLSRMPLSIPLPELSSTCSTSVLRLLSLTAQTGE